MDSALQVIVEMTESTWQRFRKDLEDITGEEAQWRPLPEANSIALIVRHLAIEARWHRASLERGDPMPHLILTGGDPLERPDLYSLIDEARRPGIEVSITPAATPALRRGTIAKLKEHGFD